MTVPAIDATTPAPPRGPVLYLVGCAAPPVHHLADAVALAQDRGFDVCVILTPTAASWLEKDLPSLVKLTGHPVRSTYKQPGEQDVLPAADAFLVAPMTLNTAAKWADAHQDNLAVGLITEAAGRNVLAARTGHETWPIVAMPYLNAWQAAHPASDRSVEYLRAMGVRVLLGEGGFAPHVPHTGSGRPREFPWERALEAIQT